ncbi:MAG: phosphoglycerate kinase [Alphaproteobacteria bacterium]|nr:phosphoglycerate kinase [Alphaproteobacteria bacterium]
MFTADRADAMDTPFLFVDDIDTAGKRCLVRFDLNVPLVDGAVGDDTRIRRVLPGLNALIETGARLVILTHLGRPKGQQVPDMSVAPVAAALAALLGRPVPVVADITGAAARDAVAAMQDGDIVMLENLRFQAGEEANDPAFAAQLAALGDIYVGDAFSCTHRAHASVEALPRMMQTVVAGRALGAELSALHRALSAPDRPVGAVVGGAKVSTKLSVLENLVKQVDVLVLGGGMANTFLLAAGQDIGASLVEADMTDTATAIAASAVVHGCQLILPVDYCVASALQAGVQTRIASPRDIKAEDMILDAGPESTKAAIAALSDCRTLVWNGPMGAFEIPPFDSATNALARAVADRSAAGKLLSVAGGGDTLAALANAGVSHDVSYISAAGGAFLEWLEGRTLPGVEALRRA